MSPIMTAFITKVLVGAGILFVIGYIGNLISFSNRFMNALVTAVIFVILFVAFAYFTGSLPTAPAPTPA